MWINDHVASGSRIFTFSADDLANMRGTIDYVKFAFLTCLPETERSAEFTNFITNTWLPFTRTFMFGITRGYGVPETRLAVQAQGHSRTPDLAIAIQQGYVRRVRDAEETYYLLGFRKQILDLVRQHLPLDLVQRQLALLNTRLPNRYRHVSLTKSTDTVMKFYTLLHNTEVFDTAEKMGIRPGFFTLILEQSRRICPRVLYVPPDLTPVRNSVANLITLITLHRRCGSGVVMRTINPGIV
jgi:hypothetical protein